MTDPRRPDAGRAGDLEARILMRVETSHRRGRRARRAAAIAWIATAAAVAGGGIAEAAGGPPWLPPSMAMAARAALAIALVLTLSWYVRDVRSRFDSIQQALAAVHDRLDEIGGGRYLPGPPRPPHPPQSGAEPPEEA